MIFQGIMLNINTIKVLIAKKNQFKILQYKISEIELNITYANKATIYFKSKMFLNSNSIIQVFIFINTIKFYVIDISILFLFYLKDIDIFGIYLNNITN